MTLSDSARANGVTYKMAWKWRKAGKLPVAAPQMPPGTTLVGVVER
jgi:predicted site-specific integrase-resolvase